MRTCLASVVLLINALGLCSCSKVQEAAKVAVKAEFTVKGEVFIVTKGSSNVRLGRQEIKIYAAAEYMNYYTAQLDKYKAAEENKRRLPAYEAYVAEAGKQLSLHIGTGTENEYRQKYNVTKKWLTDLQDELKKGSGPMAVDGTGDFFPSELPTPLISTKTDSDGKYQVRLERGTSYILSSVGQYNGETLLWLCNVPSPSQGDSLDLTLSNDNLAHVDSGIVAITQNP